MATDWWWGVWSTLCVSLMTFEYSTHKDEYLYYFHTPYGLDRDGQIAFAGYMFLYKETYTSTLKMEAIR
jgi:hypothetical protein